MPSTNRVRAPAAAVRSPVGGRHPRNKHQQRTEATRRALLRSARQIFARDGFEAARIEDVAAATGHTRGAFYAHFHTKEGLFFALLEQEAQRRVAEIRAILAVCSSEAERLARLREFFVARIADRRWAMLMLEFKLFAVRHPKVRPALAATHRRIRAAFRIEESGQSWDELKKAALEAVLSGFSLEVAYDPMRLPKRDAAWILGVLFDAVVSKQP